MSAKYEDTLRAVGIFSSLTDDQIGQISQLLTQKRYPKGAVIFEQGSVGDALYIVDAGRIKAVTRDASGNERVLALYEKGDFFGEMALLSGQTRSATIIAVTDCRVLVLRKDAFETFLSTNLQVMRQMLKVISERQADYNLLMAKDKPEEAEVTHGKIITIFSPKGGVGRSTVAVNLATMIKGISNRTVALVDASLFFGDVGVLMNLDNRTSIADLLPHVNDLDTEILDDVLVTHSSGVKVLLAPPKPEMAELVTSDHMKLILGALRENFDYIIIDTPSSFQEVTLGIFDISDLIIVLTTLELPALKNVRLFLEIADALGYPEDKVALVVNRSNSSGGISIQDVENTVHHKFVGSIVSDGRLATIATNRGVPFVMEAKDAQITQDIQRLATLVTSSGALQSIALPTGDGRAAAGVTRALRPSLDDGGGGATFGATDLVFGLGVAMTAAVVLGFLLALGRLFVSVIPPNVVTNVPVWISILGGALLTVILRPRSGGWILGAVMGAFYGIAVGMMYVIVVVVTGSSSNGIIVTLIFQPILNGILGLLGGLLGMVLRRAIGGSPGALEPA